MGKFFQIGQITGTHGLKGNIKVYPTTDDPTRFELLDEVIVLHKGKNETFEIEKVGYHKQFVLLKLKKIDDINEAEKFKGDYILIPEEKALPLDDDEYYMRDLYDMEVVSDEGEYLGTIVNIFPICAGNDVYVVRDENKPKQKDLLLPAIKQCILNVDIENRKMTVKLLKGLRD